MRIVSTTFVLLLFASLVFGQGCPADKAMTSGNSPFEPFHKIVAPTWHKAYPAKDYDAMIKAGPEFEKAFEPVAAMEAKMKNPARKAAFLKNREEFAKYVKLYAEVAKTGNKDSVYVLLPKLHDAFEQTASACMPMPYPEVEGVAVTTNLILQKHVPEKNAEGISGSTETLLTKVKALDEKSIPAELSEKKTEILQEFAAWTKLAAQMKESSDKKDMETYKKLATELGSRVNDFQVNYL